MDGSDERGQLGGHLRRIPRQQRARERVEAILAAAQELIVESGSDAMKMSEVAARAGVPIGSVYQYFPDKSAILRELALRFMERVHTVLAAGLVGLGSKAEAIDRLDGLLAGYYRFFVDEPAIREVWAATQSDKDLQRLDVDDSRSNGALLAEALAPFVAPGDEERLEVVCLLFVHLAGAAGRLAIAVDPAEGERMVAELRLVVRRHLDDLLRG
jgi:AcrR family transcriptional regulator